LRASRERRAADAWKAPAVGLDDETLLSEEEVRAPRSEADLREGSRQAMVGAEAQEAQLEDRLDLAGFDRALQESLHLPCPATARVRSELGGDGRRAEAMDDLRLLEGVAQRARTDHGREVEERARERRRRDPPVRGALVRRHGLPVHPDAVAMRAPAVVATETSRGPVLGRIPHSTAAAR
jgi:hypothetical protein